MITKYAIKKWLGFFKNNNSLYVNQREGLFWDANELAGYYNDFREKVSLTKHFDQDGIPTNYISRGNIKKEIYFPIAIFQYGLGAYDLFIETKDSNYLNKTIKMSNWAIDNQNDNGSWDTFGIFNYANSFSSMAQGEGASLLLRTYVETKREKYLIGAKKAIDFMMMSKQCGGLAEESMSDLVLYEYPDKKPVLNGWIFSAFGLLDIYKITKNINYLKYWNKTISTIENNLNNYDAGIWSFYDLGEKLASPFYHKLHISQLEVLYKITNDTLFEHYIVKWKKNNSNIIFKTISFLIKVIQKIGEKDTGEWILVE